MLKIQQMPEEQRQEKDTKLSWNKVLNIRQKIINW